MDGIEEITIVVQPTENEAVIELLVTGPSASNLNSLLDVEITSPVDGQALVYDDATGKWINSSSSGTGDVSSNTSSSVDSEIALFSGAGGKTIKRATVTGILKATSGVLSAAVAGTDYLAPSAIGTTIQGFDSDLAAIAALSPSNDDILQRKAGAWTNRSISQFKTDLAYTTAQITEDTNLYYTDVRVRANRLDQLTAPNSSLSLNSQKIVNLLDPTSAQDAATKAYVDAIAQGLRLKASVRAATTANITLSATQTIDGVALQVGDRVLVKDQSTGSQNGIYVVASGAWSRSEDANVSSEVTAGMFTFVSEGTVNGNNGFTLITDDPIVLGTTSLTFTQSSGAGQIIDGLGLTKTGNTLDVNVDNSTLEINSDSLRIKDGGVTNAKIASGLDSTKVGDGSVDNTEFSYLSGVTSGIQTQIDGKAATSHTHTASNITDFTEATQDVIGALLQDSTTINTTYDDGANTLTIDVIDNSSIQKIEITKNGGAVIGTRKQINFVEGANITLTITDDSGNGQIDVEIASSGGASGYATIQEEGSSLTQRGVINFIGTGITATDDAGNSRTNVTISPNAILGASSTTSLPEGTNLYYTDARVRLNRLDQMAAPTASVSMNSQKIVNLLDPTAAQDAATKAYVDGVASGLDIKASVRVATTANITLSGAQTIDGVSVIAGDRVLVKDQSTGSENGIYVCASGAWSRATDADSSTEVTTGLFVFVSEGTVNADSGWTLTTNDPITVGSTSLSFTQFSGAGQITAGSGLSKSGNTLDVNVDGSSIEINSDILRVKAAGITNAMLAGSIDLTTKVTGTLPVGNGGTGATTLTGVLIGNGTSAFTTKTNPSGAFVGDTDTQTVSNKTLTAPKIVNGGYIADGNGNEQIIFVTTASAVNEITVTNAATGNNPSIAATGGDTNIDLQLSGKGSGKVKADATRGIWTTDSDGATITFDLSLSNKHEVVLGGNRTLAISNASSGQVILLDLIQDGTGSRTVTWFNKASTFATTDVNTTTDVLTIGRNLPTLTPITFSSSGTLPTGLSAATRYYVINQSSTTIKVASSIANAQAGTAIDITGTGSGTHTINSEIRWTSNDTIPTLNTGKNKIDSIGISIKDVTNGIYLGYPLGTL